MKYNFDSTVDRFSSNSVKFDCQANELPMWIADMDFHVLPEIKEAIVNKANIDAYGYCLVKDEYFDSYISWWKRHHNLMLKRDWFIFSSGVVASLDSIFKSVTMSGEEVVMFTPNYNIFFNCIKNNCLKLMPCELVYKNGAYEIDWANLSQLLKRENVRILLLCNPHNPIGKIFTSTELNRMIELAHENGVLVISDEIHCDITDPDVSYVPALKACPKCADLIVTLIAPTKAFNMAGIQSSAIVVPNKKLHSLIKVGIGQDDLGDPNYFACEATIAAFSYGDDWNKEMRDYVYKNKKYVKEFLARELPRLHLVDSKATYLLWIDISSYSSNSEAFAQELRAKTGLYVAPGKEYGESGASFIRVNVATSLANVKDCCERLKKFLS